VASNLLRVGHPCLGPLCTSTRSPLRFSLRARVSMRSISLVCVHSRAFDSIRTANDRRLTIDTSPTTAVHCSIIHSPPSRRPRSLGLGIVNLPPWGIDLTKSHALARSPCASPVPPFARLYGRDQSSVGDSRSTSKFSSSSPPACYLHHE